MSQTYQLIYASEIKDGARASSVNFEVSRILIHSKRYNSLNQINGVLYCANGYFFQVLEGEKAQVLALFEKIKADQRHFNVRVLREEWVAHAQFSQWSMHLVSQTQNIRRMLSDYHMAEFIPYQFSMELLDQFLMVLSHDGEYTRPMFALNKLENKGILSSFKKRLRSHRAA